MWIPKKNVNKSRALRRQIIEIRHGNHIRVIDGGFKFPS